MLYALLHAAPTQVPDIFDLNFLFGDELDTSDDLLRKAGIDIGDNSLEVSTIWSPGGATGKEMHLQADYSCSPQVHRRSARSRADPAAYPEHCHRPLLLPPPTQVPTAGRFSLSGPAADQALVTPLELLKAGNQSAPAASSSSTNTTLTGSSNATAAAQQGDELYQLLADLSGSFDSRANASNGPMTAPA